MKNKLVGRSINSYVYYYLFLNNMDIKSDNIEDLSIKFNEHTYYVWEGVTVNVEDIQHLQNENAFECDTFETILSTHFPHNYLYIIDGDNNLYGIFSKKALLNITLYGNDLINNFTRNKNVNVQHVGSCFLAMLKPNRTATKGAHKTFSQKVCTF